MIYLRYFHLASLEDEATIYKHPKAKMSTSGGFYPYHIFPEKKLYELTFESPITILYGDNGSGKSTLLNIIAEKIHLVRNSPYNRTHWFDVYLDNCEYNGDIPTHSKIITSDDVFDFMLNLRSINEGLDKRRQIIANEYFNTKNNTSLQEYVNKLDFNNQLSIEEFERRISVAKGTSNKYIKKRIENNYTERSNGESAIAYFFDKIQENALYLLDEPENSLSPERQLQLLEYIQNSVIGCGCQFIIATHSPFLLSLKRSHIYDLDDIPVQTKKWTNLKNVRLYRDFFIEHEDEFK